MNVALTQLSLIIHSKLINFMINLQIYMLKGTFTRDVSLFVLKSVNYFYDIMNLIQNISIQNHIYYKYIIIQKKSVLL